MLAPYSCEPLYTPKEEILYPGSEDEDPPEVRRERRKRRESIGYGLLKNISPPVMLSARLLGPFEDGWVNPWRTKSREMRAKDRRSSYAEKRRRVVEDSTKKSPEEYMHRTSYTERAIYNTSPTPDRRGPHPSRSAPTFDLTPIDTRISTNQLAKNGLDFEHLHANSKIPPVNRLMGPVIPEPGHTIAHARAQIALSEITQAEAEHQSANGLRGHNRNPSYSLSSSSASLSSFPPSESFLGQQIEHKKIEAPGRAVRRVSFTGSGNVRRAGSWESTSEKNLPSPNTFQANNIAGGNGFYRNYFSLAEDPFLTSNRHTNQLSHESDAQPEAQIVSGRPGMIGAGPSTDLLETDRYNLNQQDSYADLSTQAAIRKAHQSFTRDLVKQPSDEGKPNGFHAIESELPEAAPQAKKRRTMASFSAGNPAAGANLFDWNEQEPMSTQAMVDEFSPFAMTTIKKEKHNVLGPPEAYMNGLPTLTSPLTHRRETAMAPDHPNSSSFNIGGPSAPRHRISPSLNNKRSPTASRYRTSLSPENPVGPRRPAYSHQNRYPTSPSSPLRGPSPDPSARSPHPTSPSIPTNLRPISPHWEYIARHPTSPSISYGSESPSETSPRESRSESPSPSPNLVRNNPPPEDIRVSHPANRSPTPPANSHSHPLSSFSIAPNNNTLTQTSHQQDGQAPQQQHDVPVLLSSPETTTGGEKFSIDAALDEAETFLGNWDVETEAKKEGEKAAAAASATATKRKTAEAVREASTIAAAITTATNTSAPAPAGSQRRRITQSLGIDSQTETESAKKCHEELQAKKRRLMAGMSKYK